MDAEDELYIKLRYFYDEIVMSIVHVYFEREILDKTTLILFLDKNKHNIFHLYVPSVECCECIKSYSVASPVKKRRLEDSQFRLLFGISETATVDHEKKKGNVISHHCLCKIHPKRIEVTDLDIILISTLINACFKSVPGNPKWLKEIRDVRNYLDHLGNGSSLSRQEFEAKWTSLEANTLALAGITGVSFKRSQEKRIKDLWKRYKTKEEIKAFITDANENFKEKILEILTNKYPNQDQVNSILVKIENLLFKIEDIEFKPRQAVSQGCAEPPEKCTIEWRFLSKGNINEDEMKRKLQSVTELSNFTIEFVYCGGSLHVITSVSVLMLSKPSMFAEAICRFLQQLVTILGMHKYNEILLSVYLFVSFGNFDDKKWFCENCQRQNVERKAEYWCSDCAEMCCSACKQIHLEFTTCKQQLQTKSFLDHVPDKCEIHEELFVLFCKQHDQLICASCALETHRECKSDIMSIEIAAMNVKESSMLSDLESRLSSLNKDTLSVMQECQDIVKSLDTQRQDIYARCSIRFNELRQELLTELTRKYHHLTSQAKQKEEKLQYSLDTITAIRNDVRTIKEQDSNKKIFKALKFLESKTVSDEKIIGDIKGEIRVSFMIFEPTDIDIDEYFDSSGQIVVKESILYPAEKESTGKRSQVDLLHVFSDASFENEFIFSGACLLPEDNILLSDQTNRCLVLCKNDGKVLKQIKLEIKPFDVACFELNTAVISGHMGLYQIDTKHLVIKEMMNLEFDCKQVKKASQNCLLLKVNNSTIYLYSTEDKSFKIVTLMFDMWKFCNCKYSGNLYWCGYTTDSVYCLQPDGEQLEIFRSPELKTPSGITVDKHDTVYVAGSESNNIFRISNDGKGEIILDESDGIMNPTTLDFNDEKSQLLVINNFRREIRTYDVY